MTSGTMTPRGHHGVLPAPNRSPTDANPVDESFYWLGNAYGQRLGQVGMLRQAVLAPKLRDAFLRALELDPEIHEARLNLMEYYLQAPAMVGGSVDQARAQAAELARRALNVPPCLKARVPVAI